MPRYHVVKRTNEKEAYVLLIAYEKKVLKRILSWG